MEDAKIYDRWNNKKNRENTKMNNDKFSSSFKLMVKWKESTNSIGSINIDTN